MSKKIIRSYHGFDRRGVACTSVTVLMNYFEPQFADQIRTICSMVPPFCADILIIFVAKEVAKK